jgi:hypothetical protein
MAYDDLFSQDDFVIDADDVQQVANDDGDVSWDTGNTPDIFASGEQPDIFSTK